MHIVRTSICVSLIAVLLLSASPAQADYVRSNEWHLAFLNISAAQKISRGDGVVVAVIDSGVEANHPDLVGSILDGVDIIGSSPTTQEDGDGHGTGMAGLIVAHGRPGDLGMLGIAPEAKVLPIRAGSAFIYKTADGIRWAIAHGAKVICIASGGESNRDVEDAIVQATKADAVVVAAAGNRPRDTKVVSPANIPPVVAVGGVDRLGNHANISVSGKEVVLAAPAIDIASTFINAKYTVTDGTSDATAIVAGVAALVRSKFPNLSAAEVIHRMTATAIDKGPPGRDEDYGYGIVDPVGALTKDVPPLALTPSPSRSTSIGPTSHAVPAPKSSSWVVGWLLAGMLIAVGIGVVLVIRSGRDPQNPASTASS
jgi:type VII secretion-associated serine protease mycosin